MTLQEAFLMYATFCVDCYIIDHDIAYVWTSDDASTGDWRSVCSTEETVSIIEDICHGK